MKVVLLGGGGYIGNVVAQHLDEIGHDVDIIDLFLFSNAASCGDRVRVLVGDTRQLEAHQLVGAEVVFDLAAISNDPSSELRPDLTEAINHAARVRSARMAKAAGARRYVLFSSCSVYGENQDVVDERSPVNPLTVYARCNAAAEDDLLAMNGPDFEVTAFRLATVFGPSPAMRFDLVVNTMTRSAFETGKIHVTGGGRQYRPLVHVEDIAAATNRMLSAPAAAVAGEIFNIGAMNCEMFEVASAVVAGIDRPVEIVVEDGAIDRRNYRVSAEKAKRQLGFVAERTIESAARVIFDGLAAGRLDTSPNAIRLNVYRRLADALVA